MNLAEIAKAHLAESARVKRDLSEQSATLIVQAAQRIASSIEKGGKLLLCGNGGSAADCQHIAAEFTNRLSSRRERPAMPAIALTTDTSFLTSRSNDYGFHDVYCRLVDALGREGDVLIAISTGGNSRNIANAVARAKEKRIFTVGFLGGTGGEVGGLVDLAVVVPSANTQHIQESHIAVGHIVCAIVETLLYGSLENRPEH